MRRLGGMIAAALLLLAVWPSSPAGAEFTTNEIGCAGSAVISGEGADVAVDADDQEARLSGPESAAWEGSTGTVTHNHAGSIDLAVGPASVEIGSWSSENEGDESDRSGTEELSGALGDVPPGRYELSGSHAGDEGRCAGRMTVIIEGSIFSNPISAASVALAVLGLAVLLFGAFRGRPVVAGLGGLLLGLFGGLDLVFLGAVGSGSVLVVILPILVLVVGAVAAVMFRGPGPAPGAPPPGAPA